MTAAAIDPALARLSAELRSFARDAAHGAAHGAGCACCGRGPARIDAAAVEHDALAFLSMRYRQAGDAAGEAVAERWLAAPGPGLIALLRDGDAEGPPQQDRERMTDNLLAILVAAREPAPGGGRA